MLRRRRSPAKSQRRVVRKDQLPYWRNVLQLGCVSQDSHPRKSVLRKGNWDRITPSNSPGTRGTNKKKKYGREGVHPEGTFRSVSLTSVIFSPPSLWRGHERSPCNKKDAPQSSMEVGEKYLHAQECGQSKVLLSYWSQGNVGANFKTSRGTRIRVWFRSFNAHAEQQGFGLRWDGDSAEIQKPYRGGGGQQGDVNKRWSTGMCSRSWPLRDCAITRRYACSSIAWKTMRTTRIFLWVGQQSTTTADQKVRKIRCKNGQSRTSCCSGFFVQFWYKIVFNIDIEGLVVIRSSLRSKWRIRTRRLGLRKSKTELKGEWQRRFGRPFVRYSWMVGGDRRWCGGHGSACARTRFSGLWFETFHESGIKIKEAQCSHFPKDRHCAVCLRTKITRVPCRRRTGGAVPRLEKVGDLITGDHKVLNQEGESRNNHRYAVVVRDLATQWMQSSVQNKRFTRDGKEFKKVARTVIGAKS